MVWKSTNLVRRITSATFKKPVYILSLIKRKIQSHQQHRILKPRQSEMFAFDDECTYFFHGDALLAVPSRWRTRFSAYKLLSQGDERVLPGKISARYTDNQAKNSLFGSKSHLCHRKDEYWACSLQAHATCMWIGRVTVLSDAQLFVPSRLPFHAVTWLSWTVSRLMSRSLAHVKNLGQEAHWR